MLGSTTYLLVTPVRDELENLDGLIDAVRQQELAPALWVLADGGSTDGSLARMDALAREEPWVHVLRLGAAPAEMPAGLAYARAVEAGIDHARELASINNVPFAFVANLDADVRPGSAVMAELVTRFVGDRGLGIAGCDLASDEVPGRVRALPRAALRMWRRTCLEQVGYTACVDWAGTTCLHARNRGWRSQVVPGLEAVAVRPSGEREGVWSGYREVGSTAWHVGMGPVAVAARAAAVGSPVRTMAILSGYVHSALRGAPRTRDPEVRTHYGEEAPTLRRAVRRLMGR